MSFPFNITNPGFSITGLLTSAENALVTELTNLSPTDGQIFIYDSGLGEWTVGDPAGGVSTLASLTDVTLTSPITGQLLQYNGTNWVNATVSGSGDVTAAAAFGTDNRIIRSDGTGKGVQASPITITDAGAITGATINAPDNTITNIGTSSIVDEAITLAKMAHIATSSILGRATAATGDVEALTGAQVRGIAGVDTDDSPQFAGINVGHASDTTITRVSAGVIAVEGVTVPTVSSASTLTNKTIDGDNNTITNLDIGNEVDWAVATDVADRSAAPASGDKMLLFEAGVGLRKIDWDDLPGGGSSTLDQAYDQGGAGAGRSITTDSGAVEITVPDTSNNAGLVINQNDATNSALAMQVTTVVSDGSDTVKITGTGASTFGPILNLNYNPTTGADGDTAGMINFSSKNSVGAETTFARIRADASDVTDTTEDGTLSLAAMSGGLLTNFLVYTGATNRFTLGSGSTTTLQSNGNFDLVLQTGNATTGSITITDGANGNINLAPNGTGEAQVNGERILDETDIPTGINAQTGTTYTLVLADANKNVTMSNASANTLTVPPNSSVAFPVGTKILVTQSGAGSTTIAAGSGVTINAPTTVTLAIGEQHESRGLIKVGTDTWTLM